MNNKGRGTARGVFSNWTALAINFGVAFVLSPFVVHHLGVVAYGVWTLVVATTSYMGLLDLGLRGAVIRFVSRHHALVNHPQSSVPTSVPPCLPHWLCLT